MGFEETKQAINDYFSDRSRPARETKKGLEELQADIDSMLAALHDDGVE